MNLVELLAYIRTDLLDSPRNTSPWGDTDLEMENALVRYVNQAQRFMMLKRLESDQQFYLESDTFTNLGMNFVTEGKFSVVRIPDFVFSIARIEQQTSVSAFNDAEEITHVPLMNATGDTLLRNTRIYSVRGLRWTFLGRRKLGFMGADAGGGQFRLYFTRTQPDLVYFKASDGSTTTIDVDVTTDALRGILLGREDYYVGAKIQVISASDAAPQEETAWITGYENVGGYPTFRFTFEPALSAAIAADDEIALIPNLEPEYHELLGYLSTQRALDREGEFNTKFAQSETMKQLWQQFLASGESRQSQRSTIPTFDRTN